MKGGAWRGRHDLGGELCGFVASFDWRAAGGWALVMAVDRCRFEEVLETGRDGLLLLMVVWVL